MIDKENEVYTRIKNAVKSEYTEVTLADVNFSDYQNTTSVFPFISIVQNDSYTNTETSDNRPQENSIVVTFQIDVYSNNSSKKKAECKAIMDIIDRTFQAMNFTRQLLSPTPNMADATIYRLTAKYQAVADQNNFYRR